MIRYTLRAECRAVGSIAGVQASGLHHFGKMVGHPGYAPGFSRSQAERISIFLVPDEKWRSRRVMLPLSPVRQTGESAVPLHDLEKAGQECPVSLVKWCGVTVMLRVGQRLLLYRQARVFNALPPQSGCRGRSCTDLACV